MRSTARLPSAFRSLRLLRALNIAGMGLSLAAATGGVFASIFDSFGFGLIAGVPTLIYAVCWAFLLRMKRTVGKTKLRWGWLASIPLAMANGATAAGLLLAIEEGGRFFERFAIGIFAGATFGSIFWVPGLLATLAFFGYPVARAQHFAEKGLAGEERGEVMVGAASTILAVLGCFAVGLTAGRARPPSEMLEPIGLALLYAFSILGFLAGAGAASLGSYRAARRRRFVADVEAGRQAGFRLEQVPEGKVLVRVTSQGEGYRVADVEEEILALDEAGEAIEEAKSGKRTLK
jgi:hypothetical protein